MGLLIGLEEETGLPGKAMAINYFQRPGFREEIVGEGSTYEAYCRSSLVYATFPVLVFDADVVSGVATPCILPGTSISLNKF